MRFQLGSRTIIQSFSLKHAIRMMNSLGFLCTKKSDDYPYDAFLCHLILNYKYLSKGFGKKSFSKIIGYLKR